MQHQNKLETLRILESFLYGCAIVSVAVAVAAVAVAVAVAVATATGAATANIDLSRLLAWLIGGVQKKRNTFCSLIKLPESRFFPILVE